MTPIRGMNEMNQSLRLRIHFLSHFVIKYLSAIISLRELSQQAVRLDDWLQYRVRDDHLVFAGDVRADLITVEGDLQSDWRDVPTVKVIDLRSGALFGGGGRLQFLQPLDRVV